MLKKVDDDFARPEEASLVEQCVTSVTTGAWPRSRREATSGGPIAAAKGGRQGKASAARRFQAPQLATLVDGAGGNDWLHRV
jgi:hypothetical protein